MARIYKITNNVTGEIYIGATTLTLKERWVHHKRDAKKKPHRKLYQDMNFYGFQSFRIEEVEQFATEKMFEREIHWIEKFDSYENGYNDTYGGAGKRLVDEDVIEELWHSGKSTKEIHKLTGYAQDTIKRHLAGRGVSNEEVRYQGFHNLRQPVLMIDKNTNETISIFPSISDAGRQTGILREHIGRCCRGIRKTAGGYKWNFCDSSTDIAQQ